MYVSLITCNGICKAYTCTCMCVYILPFLCLSLLALLIFLDSHKSQKQDYSEMSDLMPKAKAIRDFEPSSSLEMRVQVHVYTCIL